jgi:Holliday junction resolvase RusA-like endonuclease
MTRSNSGSLPVAQSVVEGGRGGPASSAASVSQRLVIEAWLPESLANGSHGHWSTRQRKLDRAGLKVWYYGKAYLLRPITGRARVTVTLVFPQNRRRDTDNLYARVKGVVDGLVKGGWIVDDDTEHLDLIVRAEVRPGVKATELLLEPVE